MEIYAFLEEWTTPLGVGTYQDQMSTHTTLLVRSKFLGFLNDFSSNQKLILQTLEFWVPP